MNNIVLIGYMGCGKSAVAKELHRQTGRNTVDMDLMIEEQAGETIAEIFSREGEEGFRRRETAVLRALTGADNTVVSTGGGVVIREENRVLLKKMGKVIWLKASPSVVYNRISGDVTTRPLLAGNMSEEYIAGMMEERSDYYASCADAVLDTDTMTPEELARKIREMMEE